MKKRLLFAVLAAVAVTLCACGTPKDVVIKEGTAAIKAEAYKGKKIGSVVIPEGVTEIGNSAFEGCTQLKSVTLPQSLETIGNAAFSGCSSLTEIVIPDGVTLIYNDAFRDCTALGEITVPGSLTKISPRTFRGCTSLKTAVIQDGVENIGVCAFEDCTALEHVRLPESVKAAQAYVFSNCPLLKTAGPDGSGCNVEFSMQNGGEFPEITGLTEMTVPESVTEIYGFALPLPDGIEKLVFNSMPKVDKYAFAKRTDDRKTFPNLKTAGPLGSGADIGLGAGEAVPEKCFTAFISLEEAVIPEGVGTVGAQAFSDLKLLTSVTLPETVKTIGTEAFTGCTALSEIGLENVTEIGKNAFKGTPFGDACGLDAAAFVPAKESLAAAEEFADAPDGALQGLVTKLWAGDKEKPEWDLIAKMPAELRTFDSREADFALYKTVAYSKRSDYRGDAYDCLTDVYLVGRDGSVRHLKRFVGNPPLKGTGVGRGQKATVTEIWNGVKRLFG